MIKDIEKRRAYYREYNKRPEVIARRKQYMEEYYSRPDVIKRLKKWKKEYNLRPGVVEKQRARASKQSKEYLAWLREGDWREKIRNKLHQDILKKIQDEEKQKK